MPVWGDEIVDRAKARTPVLFLWALHIPSFASQMQRENLSIQEHFHPPKHDIGANKRKEHRDQT